MSASCSRKRRFLALALGSIGGVIWGQKPVGSEDVVSPVEMGLHGEPCSQKPQEQASGQDFLQYQEMTL